MDEYKMFIIEVFFRWFFMLKLKEKVVWVFDI